MGGGQDGAGAGSAAGIIGAGAFASALRFGAAFFAFLTFFFAAFLATFSVFFFLAGAAFFFFPGFLFAFDFFAMIVLPIHVESPSAPNQMGDRVHTTATTCSAHCRAGVPRRRGPMTPKRLWAWSARSPIDQLNRMHNGKFRARRDLRDATDIAGSNHIRAQLLDSPDFALAQPSCDVRLKNIVGADRAAAQMTFRYIFDLETDFAEKILWLARDPLAMLQRAGGVISDHESGRLWIGLQRNSGEVFADVLGESRYACRALRVGPVGAQHEAVILDRRSAARSVDEDRVGVLDGRPGVDICTRLGQCLTVAAHVMDE